jgi:hypothetical protein
MVVGLIIINLIVIFTAVTALIYFLRVIKISSGKEKVKRK